MYTTLRKKLLYTFYIYIQVQTYTYSIFQLQFNFNRFLIIRYKSLIQMGVYTILLEALDTGHSIVTWYISKNLQLEIIRLLCLSELKIGSFATQRKPL